MKDYNLSSKIEDKMFNKDSNAFLLFLKKLKTNLSKNDSTEIILTSISKTYQSSDETEEEDSSIVEDFTDVLIYVFNNFTIKKRTEITAIKKNNKIKISTTLYLKKEELEDFTNYVRSLQPSE